MSQIKIIFKLYAGLAQYLPEGASNHRVEVAIKSSETVNELLLRYNVPLEQAHLVLRNGVYVQPDEREQQGFFQEGDTLAIWPPVAGG